MSADLILGTAVVGFYDTVRIKQAYTYTGAYCHMGCGTQTPAVLRLHASNRTERIPQEVRVRRVAGADLILGNEGLDILWRGVSLQVLAVAGGIMNGQGGCVLLLDPKVLHCTCTRRQHQESAQSPSENDSSAQDEMPDDVGNEVSEHSTPLMPRCYIAPSQDTSIKPGYANRRGCKR